MTIPKRKAIKPKVKSKTQVKPKMKPKTSVNIPIVNKRQSPTMITAQIGANILIEYHEKGYRVPQISATYNLSQRAVYTYLKNNEYTPAVQFNYRDVLVRSELEPLQRIKLLGNDAAQNLELVMASMNYKLLQELEATKDNASDKTATLSVKELTAFFSEVAPYVLSKVEGNATSREKNKPTAKGKAYEMFKSQMEVKKAN